MFTHLIWFSLLCPPSFINVWPRKCYHPRQIMFADRTASQTRPTQSNSTHRTPIKNRVSTFQIENRKIGCQKHRWHTTQNSGFGIHFWLFQSEILTRVFFLEFGGLNSRLGWACLGYGSVCRYCLILQKRDAIKIKSFENKNIYTYVGGGRWIDGWVGLFRLGSLSWMIGWLG